MQGTQHARLFDRLLGRAPDYVSFGLVIVFGFLLARLTWMLFPADPLALNSTPDAGTNPANVVTAPQSLGDKLASYHLFGQYQTDGVKPVAANIQNTQLALRLQGLYAPSKGAGFAVIEEGGKQKTYAIGENIGASGAVLEKVLGDHVLLRRNGALEKLVLPKLGQSQGNGSAATAGITDLPTDLPVPSPDFSQPAADMMPPPEMFTPSEGAIPPPPSEPLPEQPPQQQPPAPSADAGAANVGDFRQAVLNNNMRLMEVASPQPYERDGKFLGFQLSPGSNVAMFNQLGLQAGDIVTAVNGTVLENPAIAMRLLQEAATASSVNLNITRNGQEVSLPINFQ
jgi:type II secretory pathway component PulC